MEAVVAVVLSGGVDCADAPLLNDACAECNMDLEDIVFTAQLLLEIVSLLRQGLIT